MRHCRVIAVILTAALGAYAQDVDSGPDTVSGWSGLDASNLNTVHVLDDTGRETTGRLIRLNPDSLVVLVDGTERTFDADRVRRLDKRGDTLKNGAVIGAIVGAILSTIGAAISDCPDAGSGCAGTRVAMAVLGTGIYASVGTGIDAVHTGRTTLYESPSPSPSAAGGVGRDHAVRGATVSIGFSW